MDHDIFSSNVTSSFLDDLTEISQEPLNICNYPQTSRLQNSNAYNRELYASQSTMNYYPVVGNMQSHQNYQRSNNMYSYNFPNYEYNTNVSDQRINRPYIQSSNSDNRIFDMSFDNIKMMENDRMNLQPNNFISSKNTIPNSYIDDKYQNLPKYYSMSKNNYQPNQLYRTSDFSSSLHNESMCMTYHYPPQYFPNDSQQIYYDHGISHLNERQKVERLTLQNIASIDQSIYNLENKLHFLTQNLPSNPNCVHEINEIKEKLIYFNQLKEKYLLTRNKLNYNFNNKSDINENKDVVGLKPLNNYSTPQSRSDEYNSQNSNLSQFYSHNVNKPYETTYAYNFMPNNNQQYNEKFNPNDHSNETEQPLPCNVVVDNSTPKSFVSELTGSDFSQTYIANNSNKQYNNNRDELSTPPMSDFTDLQSVMPSLKSSQNNRPNIVKSKEPVELKNSTETDSNTHYNNHHAIKSPVNSNDTNQNSSTCSTEIKKSTDIDLFDKISIDFQNSIDEIKIDKIDSQESCKEIDNSSSPLIPPQSDYVQPQCPTAIIHNDIESLNEIESIAEINSAPQNNIDQWETFGDDLKDITNVDLINNEKNVENIDREEEDEDKEKLENIVCDNDNKQINDHEQQQLPIDKIIEPVEENEIQSDINFSSDENVVMTCENNMDDKDRKSIKDDVKICLNTQDVKEVDSVVSLKSNEINIDKDDLSKEITTTTTCEVKFSLFRSFSKKPTHLPRLKNNLHKMNHNLLNVSKLQYSKFKKYNFYINVKKLHQKYYLSRRFQSNISETNPNISIRDIKSKISKKIDIKKKSVNHACKIAKRMKNVESFLKKKNSKGSYFNNFDVEERNISKKSLRRNSSEFHITTRVKKETSFEFDSNEENSLNSDDEIQSNFELNLENQNKIVQKILGSRIVSGCDLLETSSSKVSESEVEEYYLKYRGFSYIHCEWKSVDSVSDPSFPSKLKRYKNIKMNNVDESDECLFNPDYVEIDRVLDSKQIELNKVSTSNVAMESVEFPCKETITYYLVKWRGLPYEEITWEKSENVDPSKVKEYLQRNINGYSENAEITKPTHKNWKPITADRIYKNGNVLRDYQLEGVNWLTFCWLTNRNCILADEMGLGKTIQSIAFLIELFDYGFKGPFLIIVPLSTLGNWQREFEQWSNLNVILYHGSAKSRRLIRNYESVLKSSEHLPQSNKLIFNAIITTYEVLLSDLLFFSKFQWTASIIDEAHRLKNKRCKLIEGLRMLDLQFRVLLTGTPLQNNVQELFNLLNFLESSKFFCESDFLSQYGDLRSEEQVASLKILLQPMMLRRLKEDVEKSLAPKEEIVVEVELTNIQKKYYRAILERNFTFLSKGVSGNNIPNLMNTMMELRKCCNHPFLIKGAEEAILNNFKSGTDMGNITKFIQNKIIDEETLQFYSMVYSSGKLVLIHKLLPKLKQDSHKVLIFSQMVRVLDILEDYLIYEKYQYERIDGRIHGLLRQEAIDRFSSDPEKFIFLLCTKAGGLGINLTAADVVIIYDSDWNPQNDLQAQARCHRIGQQKLVNVYRLITRNTYEREMFDRASLKLGLDKAILQSMTYTESKPVSQLSKKEIEDLLKLGAYGALMDDDKDGEKFCEEDIDKILLSRSTVVKLNSTDRNSSFSKASFSISDNRSDIKLDDPNFWQKWAKKAGVDESEICNSLIMDKPRLRRQTNRYKPNCTLFDEISGDDSNSSIFDCSKLSGSHTNIKMSYPKSKKKITKVLSFNPSSSEIKDTELEETGSKPATQDMDRYDLFKAEKCLLQFGWGRWEHALEKISFKVPISAKELEMLCKTILNYAHRNYSGDDRIYSFIEDLMLPESDISSMRQHLGYSTPVARGRRGRKGLEEMISTITKKDFVVTEVTTPTTASKTVSKKNCDTVTIDDVNNLDEEHSDVLTNISTPISVNGENSDNDSEFAILICPNFRKHIQRTSHKLLHRIQFLYFLNHEIIGLQRAQLILNNVSYTEIPGFPELKLFIYLESDYLPSWWNSTVDKCLLLGIFKHGWEKYDEIYKDPAFGFVDWLSGVNYPVCSDDESQVKEQQNSRSEIIEQVEALDNSDPSKTGVPDKNPDAADRKDDFPTNAELNIRLRKIIGSFQKLWRQKETEKTKIRTMFQTLDTILSNSESSSHVNNDGKTMKWSRREETEFYRAVNSYGIEKDQNGEMVWTNFRNACNLSRKSNESLTEYFKAFYTMCQKICQKYPLLYGENHSIEVENISTERASRCLMKINIMSKIRNEIIVHPELEDRIKYCESTIDFPSWWIAGYHDLSILKGISKYGATRTELSIISDPELGFKQAIIDLLKQQLSSSNGNGINNNSNNNNNNKNVSIETINAVAANNPIKSYIKVSVTSSKSETTVEENSVDMTCLNDDPDISTCGSPAELSTILEQIEPQVVDQTFDILIIDTIKEITDQSMSQIPKDSSETDEPNFENIPFDISVLSKIGWPKERILFSRLELIVQTVEKGEWPLSKSQTSSTPNHDREIFPDSTKVNKDETIPIFNTSKMVKAEPQLSTFKTKRRGRKRTVTSFIPPTSLNDGPRNDLIKLEDNVVMPEEPNLLAAYDSWSAALSMSLTNDPALMLQKMLQMSPDIGQTLQSSSSANDLAATISRVSNSNMDLDLSQLFKLKSSSNDSNSDSVAWSSSQTSSTPKINKNNVRRGRRPKHSGPYDISRDYKRDLTSNLHMFNNRLINSGPSNEISSNSSNQETVIPVINIFNGTVIYDETAPKRKNLETFLMHNVNYMPYSIEEEDQKIFNKVAKARGQETGPLESMIFAQYMNFMMSTMLGSASPFNLYNSLLLQSTDGLKNSSLSEEQVNASSIYMQQYQESILSMLGASNHSIVPPGLDLKAIVNDEELGKGKRRSNSPIKNTGIPAKIKSYSISHLTDDRTTDNNNKTMAHSNLASSIGEKTDEKSKSINNINNTQNNICSNINSNTSAIHNSNKVQTMCEPSTKHIHNQNADILASYQAYIYNAMLYSDYISSMQQYSFLNNNTNKIDNTMTTTSATSTTIATTAIASTVASNSEIFNDFKHPLPNTKPNNDLFQPSNNNHNHNNNQSNSINSKHYSAEFSSQLSSLSNSSSSSSSLVLPCSPLFSSSSSHFSSSSSSNSSKANNSKRAKVTSFSVESMGITASSSLSSIITSTNDKLINAIEGMVDSAETSEVLPDSIGDDDYAVLDLSNR